MGNDSIRLIDEVFHLSTLNYTESSLSINEADFSEVIPAGEGFMKTIHQGDIVRLVDMEGNQAIDTLFYSAKDFSERYSAQDTITTQKSVYLTTGTTLMSSEMNPLLTIVADTCGRHDTLGGACSRESNTMRYAHDKLHMHACRDTFLLEMQKWGSNQAKRDITCNINFFMNVPLTREGGLSFEDGVSSAGRYVELRAEQDVVILISNCPQLNNPCNAYNPTSAQVVIWKKS
jgi:urea carboxylase-associated protein 1